MDRRSFLKSFGVTGVAVTANPVHILSAPLTEEEWYISVLNKAFLFYKEHKSEWTEESFNKTLIHCDIPKGSKAYERFKLERKRHIDKMMN